MFNITRKKIEEYFSNEWQNVVSSKSLNLLIELTCKAYKLNQPKNINSIRIQQIPAVQNLGVI